MAPYSYRGRLASDDAEDRTHSQSLDDAQDSRPGVRVGDIVTRRDLTKFTVAPDASILAAIEAFNAMRPGALLVVDDQARLLGIVSEHDLVTGLRRDGLGLFSKNLSEVMTRDVVTCGPDEPILNVMRKMTEGGFRHVPVCVDGRVIGLVTTLDVMQARLDEVEYENLKMRQVIVG